MNLAMLLEMAADGLGDRVAVGPKADGTTFEELLTRSRRAAAWLAARGAAQVAMVDLNSPAVPTVLFGAAFAGLPFVPVNYRIADEQLRAILARVAPAVVIVDPPVVERIGTIDGIDVVTRPDFMAAVSDPSAPMIDHWEGSGDEVAVLLFTSGTTGEPKAAVLRHRHLVHYVITTVEFMGSDEDEAALVSVPPYHVAGISAILTGTYGGRRLVQMAAFDPKSWVEVARDEGITQAMVVPTMLGRILDVLEEQGSTLPALRALSYGGGRMPLTVIERAMQLLPGVDYVNAYGLTETSSTIAVLGPEDHREAFASDDPTVRARLGSVGRPLPVVEIEIRDPDGAPVGPGVSGEIYVRGEQISGEYLGRKPLPEGGWFATNDGGHLDEAGFLYVEGRLDDVIVRGEQIAGEYLGRSVLTEDGWFPTNDAGFLDAEGYLFLDGRLDDVIVRGAENLSPGEIEDRLVAHPDVAEAAVVGVPDDEWGEKVVAAVVLHPGAHATEDELRTFVRDQLRSSRTPEHIGFREELPYSETGKLLRRVLRTELATEFAPAPG